MSSASPPGEVTSFAAYGRLPAGQHEVRFLLSAAHQDGRLRRLVEAAANNKGSTEAVALLALMHGMTNTTVRNCSEVMMVRLRHRRAIRIEAGSRVWSA